MHAWAAVRSKLGLISPARAGRYLDVGLWFWQGGVGWVVNWVFEIFEVSLNADVTIGLVICVHNSWRHEMTAVNYVWYAPFWKGGIFEFENFFKFFYFFLNWIWMFTSSFIVGVGCVIYDIIIWLHWGGGGLFKSYFESRIFFLNLNAYVIIWIRNFELYTWSLLPVGVNYDVMICHILNWEYFFWIWMLTS